MLKCLIVLMLSLYGCLANFNEYDLQEFDSDRFSGTQTSENGCRKDILIMWDNSQSIGFANFLVVKKFLKQLIVKLNVSPEGTHLGFLTFSDKRKTKRLLDVGTITDPKKLLERLDNYDYDLDLMGSSTRTGKAFQIANSMFRSNSPKNHRVNADDVVLLFTDGRPETDTVDGTLEETNKAKKYAESLKQKGIRIVCISAGEKEQVYKYTKNLKLWATNPSLVITAGFDKLKIEENVEELAKKLITPLCSKTVVEPARCGCKGGGILSFKVFAEPGETKTMVHWIESEIVTCSKGTYKKGKADRESGENFSLGKHSIIQRYWYNDSTGNRLDFQCSINFTVSVCDCPDVQQVEAERLSGENKEANVTWDEPHPNCPAMPNPNNPVTQAGMFTAGEHTVMYRYRVQNRFNLECPVSIIVPGEFCGDIAYKPETTVCCCRKIYTKKVGDHKCCGDKYINFSKKMCCQGDTPMKRPGPCPKM